MSTLAQLIVKIGADTSDLTKGMKKTNKEIETTGTKLKSLGKMVANPVIAVKDTTSAVISRVRSNLMSLRGLATITLAIVGANKLGDATLGAAMSMEQQQISLSHWLKGNEDQISEVSTWLEKFAARTPFEMTDLFPAMTRAIGVSDGDVKTAERLVSVATDMAALTPGKNVQDAMEALADAQMGEYERLKEFNMKYSKAQADAAGGFTGLIAEAEKKFAGGADKLSESSAGLLSTIYDNIKTYFRKAGEGVLSTLTPRLKMVTEWFEKHPKTVEKWKNQLVTLGRQAGEFVMVRLEGAFKHIQKNYINNPEFTNLDFAGKVNFIIDDISELFNNWLENGGSEKFEEFGATLGNLIGKGLMSVAPNVGEAAATALLTAFTEGLKRSPLGAIFVGAIGGAGIGTLGIPGLGTGVGAVIGGGAGGVTYVINQVIDPNDDKPTNTTNSSPQGSNFGGFKSIESGRKPNNTWIGDRLKIDGNAAGTSFWRGGLTWVGEKGPELLNLPRGSQITSNKDSMAMLENGLLRVTGTVYHVFQTNNKQMVASLAEEYNRQLLRLPGRVSTIPIEI